jgi:hypothetical protein
MHHLISVPRRRLTLKEKVEIAQAIVTMGAVFIGGLWTYELFIKERQEYPHANIEQKISHLPLSDKANLLHVEINVANTGKSLIAIEQSTIRVQQILPLSSCPEDDAPCAAKELNEAGSESGAAKRPFHLAIDSGTNSQL